MLGIDSKTQIGRFNFDCSLRLNHHIQHMLSYFNCFTIGAHIDLVIALTKVHCIGMFLRPLTVTPLEYKKADNEHYTKNL